MILNVILHNVHNYFHIIQLFFICFILLIFPNNIYNYMKKVFYSIIKTFLIVYLSLS